MADIARLAGVNQSTVSRVLAASSGSSISRDVRSRILRVVRRLDYQRNPSAVALRTGSTHTILVVISDVTDTYYSAIISGIEQVLVQERFSMILHSLAHHEMRQQLPGVFHQYRLDGALMLGALPGLDDQDILSLGRRGVPLVLVGRSLRGKGIGCVYADNRAGGRLAAKHLIDLGHTAIAVMRGPRGWPDFTQRLAGMRQEIAARGYAPGMLTLFPCHSRQPEAGYEATTALLEQSRPTALFCLNDMTALGAMRSILDAGMRVPEDISVLGFDDGDHAAFASPPLTTMRQPRFRMGTLGAEMLISSIANSTPPAERSRCEVTLVERRSTCPPR
jgi:DNA-binding LacI/PurR family transcriptional regulator